ncbi:hypothetical protein [Rhodococcus tibetensis]|uniref:Uncharacterized protein n=1 Tax=Rhodococcus tibetensis TaxID=2965064 RepID=A0ABT1QDQ8_9NOCA|nr:hypothetical protein [Rhodococcus sp. FXJ9.536]MCQ4120411.1 hypothetical protein [Rhodococcus sp. FXJ9.536]
MSTVLVALVVLVVGITVGVLVAGALAVIYLARIADALQPESDTLEEKS